MVTKDAELKRHPLAIAWDEWLVSAEGNICANIHNLPHSNPQYLENRLHRAFDAGAEAQLAALQAIQTKE